MVVIFRSVSRAETKSSSLSLLLPAELAHCFSASVSVAENLKRNWQKRWVAQIRVSVAFASEVYTCGDIGIGATRYLNYALGLDIFPNAD